MFHVIVPPQISRRIHELIPNNRESLLTMLNQLYHQLENHADRYRGQRDPEDPDLFDYVQTLYIDNRWRVFRFSVNDTMATDHLFVEAVSASN